MKLNVTVQLAAHNTFAEGQEVTVRTRSYTIIDSDDNYGNGTLPMWVHDC